MIKSLQYLLFILFLSGNATSQPFPTINSSRPRILIDSSRIAWLQSNRSTGDCAATYNNLVARYISNWITDPQLYQVGSDTTIWTWTWSSKWSGDQTRISALLYKLSPDTLQKKRILYIIDHFIWMIDTANWSAMDWYTKETMIRNMSNAGDVLLDWCYDSIPVFKRGLLAQALYKINRDLMNEYILSSAGTAYVGSHNDLNCVFANQNAITLHSADGLTTAQNDTVTQWFDTVYNKWVNNFFPVYRYYRGIDGGWNWSGAYAMWSLTDQFVLFDNMKFGTNKNFYISEPWILNSINQYWYTIQPNNNCINQGDGGMALTGDNVIYRHAAVYADTRSQWMAQYYAQPSMLTWTMPVFNKLMYFDFTASTVAKPNLPLDWYAEKKGMVVSRTSWDSSSAMIWHFNSLSKKNNHEHWDNNSFCIFKHQPLLIDAGDYDYYGSPHWYNYYIRTIAHNSICVFDSTENYTYGSIPISNDGGQKYNQTLISYADIFAAGNQRGKWLKYAPGSNYCYTIADASLAYDTAKLDRFVRRVLFDKPDHVIVLDHIHLRHTATRQRDASFLLHFTEKPAISGSLISAATPSHIETYNGKDYSVSQGKGNIAIRTLLPSSSNTSLIGGTGYEYWVNGTNYPPSVVPDTLYQTPGKWRLEVRPNVATDSLLFLHTIKIGDSLSPSVAGGSCQKNNFSIGVDWDNTLYYFDVTGDTQCDYHLMTNLAGGRSVAISGFDLFPFATYQVKINNTLYASATSDSNGTLKSNAILPSGLCKVEIVRKKVAVPNMEVTKTMFKIYPNPACDAITIGSLPIAQIAPLIVKIFNIEGKLLFSQLANIGQPIPINLPAGLYMIRLETENETQTSQLIIGK